jgi:uroporphyrinogen-III synthase
MGWQVDLRPTHDKTARPLPWTPLRMALEGEWLDAAVWTAASQIRAAAAALPDVAWSGVRHVAIGRQTAEALAAVGWAAQTAASPDLDAVVAALAEEP